MIIKRKTMKIKIQKTTKIAIVVLMLMLAADWLYFSKVAKQPRVRSNNLQEFSADELAKYNGSDESLPIYLAYDGYVYDVSAGRDDFYGPGEAYNYLVGKDSSNMLKIFGGDIIKRKYSVVGVYLP